MVPRHYGLPTAIALNMHWILDWIDNIPGGVKVITHFEYAMNKVRPTIVVRAAICVNRKHRYLLGLCINTSVFLLLYCVKAFFNEINYVVIRRHGITFSDLIDAE